MAQSLWGAVRRTIPMGLLYGAGLQPLMILVNLPPWGAAPVWYETRLRRFIALENDRSALSQMYILQGPG